MHGARFPLFNPLPKAATRIAISHTRVVICVVAVRTSMHGHTASHSSAGPLAILLIPEWSVLQGSCIAPSVLHRLLAVEKRADVYSWVVVMYLTGRAYPYW